MNKLRNITNSNDGFTIIEFMIATAILGVILVLASTMILGIGKLLDKGTNLAAVQDATRSTLDQVTQDIMYSASPPVAGPSSGTDYNGVTVYSYCIGNVRYSYTLGNRVGDSGVAHVLWRDNIDPAAFSAGSVSCPPLDLSESNPEQAQYYRSPTDVGNDGQDLIANDSRLTCFQIMPGLGTSYSVYVGQAYGISSDFSGGTTSSDCHSGLTVSCAGGDGDEYCATDELSSSVTPRVSSGD